MSVVYKKLEEVCEILDSQRIPITAKDRKAGQYPYYGANGLQDYVAEYIFDDELVLLAEDGGNFGSTDRPIAYRVSGKCWVNNHAHVLKAKSCIDIDYLGYSLMFYDTSGLVNGATRQKLTQAAMREMKIPYRNSDEQKEIVKKIDGVFCLIEKRHLELHHLDQLVKSRFVEMFGDLVQGDRISTNRRKIGEIASVTKLAGFEFTKYIHYKDKGEKDDVIMLRGLNCKNGHLVLDDIKWIDKGTSDILPRSKLYAGDILMTYAGTIGDVALVDADDKYHLAPNVGKITLADKKKYNPVFVIHLFMYSHDYIMTFASQVAQASINMEKIRNFEFFFPETEQQNRFAAFVAEVDKSKLAVKQSLEKLETLKKSLMQQYFG